MARISTYDKDQSITPSDKWIGTDSMGSITRNFTAQSVADFMNNNSAIAIVGQNNFFFQTDLSNGRFNGTISFANGGGVDTAFNSLTTIRISKYAASETLVIDYLLTLVGRNVFITQTDDLNNFGTYKLLSLIQDIDEPNFYNASFEFVESNGVLKLNKFYAFSVYPSLPVPFAPGDYDLSEFTNTSVDPFAKISDLPTSNALSALPFSTDHLTATNNQYVIDDVVYYLGDVYKCIANNDSIIPTSTSYWENIGPGFPIVQQPIDWTSTTGNNQILNKPTIPSITGLVPYTGATGNVDLGTNNIISEKFIKNGGQSYQFLKADGSVDDNTYLTPNNLASNIILYPTNAQASVTGYYKLVTSLNDPDYNTEPVDIPTGNITTTDQLIANLASEPNILVGNPGIFNITIIGDIRKTVDSGSGKATFFFKAYKRTSGGTETLVATSDPTIPVDSDTYTEFSASGIWNDGDFLSTDRIVLKFYANRIAGASDPNYEIQFGGSTPVRTFVPVPIIAIPNIYLKDLADVENIPAEDNEILYWNDANSLWKHSLVEDLVPLATAIQKGLVSIEAQTFAGEKTFASNIKIPATGSELILSVNSGGIVSGLETTYYASPFELTYLKGVTSPIQTQIDATNVNVITITTAGASVIDTNTQSGVYEQHGRHVKINQGAVALNIQCLSTSNADFVASYEKIGAAAITFTATLPATLVPLSGTNQITAVAAVGSKACLSRNGNVYYLQITNY